jgi:microcystin-dependent protein
MRVVSISGKCHKAWKGKRSHDNTYIKSTSKHTSNSTSKHTSNSTSKHTSNSTSKHTSKQTLKQLSSKHNSKIVSKQKHEINIYICVTFFVAIDGVKE